MVSRECFRLGSYMVSRCVIECMFLSPTLTNNMLICPQDQLPEFVKNMFLEAKKHSAGARRRQTQIINEAFDRNADGTLALNLNKPMFHSYFLSMCTLYVYVPIVYTYPLFVCYSDLHSSMSLSPYTNTCPMYLYTPNYNYLTYTRLYKTASSACEANLNLASWFFLSPDSRKYVFNEPECQKTNSICYRLCYHTWEDTGGFGSISNNMTMHVTAFAPGGFPLGLPRYTHTHTSITIFLHKCSSKSRRTGKRRKARWTKTASRDCCSQKSSVMVRRAWREPLR